MAEKTHKPDHGGVRAGRVDQLKPRKHTPEGLQRLRETALRNRPWQYTTGPRTPEGKARVAENGRYAQKSEVSRRQMRRELADTRAMVDQMAAVRHLACPDPSEFARQEPDG